MAKIINTAIPISPNKLDKVSNELSIFIVLYLIRSKNCKSISEIH